MPGNTDLRYHISRLNKNPQHISCRVYCENEKREKKSGGGGMCTKNGSYCEKEKKVRGVRVDVNGEVKLL